VTRYRCSACGNLTRFDVTVHRRTRSFHHYTVGGELTVEEEQVLAESIEEVACRWCGHGRSVSVISEDHVSEGDLSEGDLTEGNGPEERAV
jgi:hypothetical protein